MCLAPLAAIATSWRQDLIWLSWGCIDVLWSIFNLHSFKRRSHVLWRSNRAKVITVRLVSLILRSGICEAHILFIVRLFHIVREFLLNNRDGFGRHHRLQLIAFHHLNVLLELSMLFLTIRLIFTGSVWATNCILVSDDLPSIHWLFHKLVHWASLKFLERTWGWRAWWVGGGDPYLNAARLLLRSYTLSSLQLCIKDLLLLFLLLDSSLLQLFVSPFYLSLLLALPASEFLLSNLLLFD